MKSIKEKVELIRIETDCDIIQKGRYFIFQKGIRSIAYNDAHIRNANLYNTINHLNRFFNEVPKKPSSLEY